MKSVCLRKRQLPRLFFTVLGCLCAFLPLFSCAARITGSLQETSQAELVVHASLQPRMAALLRRLAAAAGSVSTDRPVLDGAVIAASLAAAPGIASASFRNTAPAVIEGPVQVSRIGELLASNRGVGFIQFEQGASGGRCLITLSRDSAPQLLSLLSPEFTACLGALMAPLATGEALGKAEYLALVGMVYGSGIADEISQSSIAVSVEVPGPVQTVRGGTFSGRRADFAIPLLDLLALETALTYELVWK